MARGTTALLVALVVGMCVAGASAANCNVTVANCASCEQAVPNVCEECDSEYYLDSNKDCMECSTCASGEVATQACTATQDTVCETQLGAGDVELDVIGQSGKFDLVPVVDGKRKKSEAVRVAMDSLRELDASGNQIANSGSQSVKHSIQSFAPKSFSITGPNATVYQGVQCQRFRFYLSPLVDGAGSLIMDTYLFTESGNLTFGAGALEETFEVDTGSMKFNVEIEDFPFCDGGNSQPCSGDTGAFVELTMGVTGPDSPKGGGKNKLNNTVYDLGSGAVVELSQLMKIGDAFTSDGTVTFSSNSLVLKFPRPDAADPNFMLYDPVLTFDTTNSAATMFSAATLLLAVVAMLFTTSANVL